MRSPIAALAAVLAVLCGLLAGLVPGAQADPVLPVPTYPTAPFGDPTGANDWHCRPTAARPEPGIIVHGTFGARQDLLDAQKAIMSTELLPGEDRALLPGPDRIELYPVLEVHDLDPDDETRS